MPFSASPALGQGLFSCFPSASPLLICDYRASPISIYEAHGTSIGDSSAVFVLCGGYFNPQVAGQLLAPRSTFRSTFQDDTATQAVTLA
jgi:hypothetical protein